MIPYRTFFLSLFLPFFISASHIFRIPTQHLPLSLSCARSLIRSYSTGTPTTNSIEINKLSVSIIKCARFLNRLADINYNQATEFYLKGIKHTPFHLKQLQQTLNHNNFLYECENYNKKLFLDGLTILKKNGIKSHTIFDVGYYSKLLENATIEYENSCDTLYDSLEKYKISIRPVSIFK